MNEILKNCKKSMFLIEADNLKFIEQKNPISLLNTIPKMRLSKWCDMNFLIPEFQAGNNRS